MEYYFGMLIYQMEKSTYSRILNSKYKKASHVLLPRAKKDQCCEEEDLKTLFFDSEDNYIKKILVNRGWRIGSQDQQCTLQWVYHVKNNTFSQLGNKTKINHFQHSHLLTTKLGLCKTLKNQKNAIINHNGCTHTSFYPRSYDLSEQNDEFIKDFKTTAILNLLKKIMIAIEMQNSHLFSQLHNETSLFRGQKKQINWLSELQTLYSEGKLYKQSAIKSNTFIINGQIFEKILLYFSLMFTLDQEEYSELDEEDVMILVGYSQLDPPYRSIEEHYDNDKSLIKCPTQQALRLFFRLYRESLQRFEWFRTDGLRNVWVVKANDSSRGRSIFLISSLQQLKSLNSGTRLIQKYLEDVWIFRSEDSSLFIRYPFLHRLHQKKFDLRIWVLVLSFSPLKVYIYDEGYLRISQQKYQLNQLDRNCTHLTNYSVNWKTNPLEDQENSYVMLSEFMDFLEREQIKNKERLKEEIQDIVRQSLEAADLGVGHSDPRCFQLYGYDIILDSELKPWLLEVNMSPACKERGRLVQQVDRMGKGLLGLVGLIQSDGSQSKWTPLINVADKAKGMKKENFPKLQTKTESTIRPSMSKCFSVRSTENSAKQPPTLLPSLVKKGDSIHDKYQNVSSIGSTCDLVVSGKGYSSKSLLRIDRSINVINAVRVIQKYFTEKIQKRKQQDNMKLQKTLLPLTFLRIVQCLIVLAARTKLRVFRKLKRSLKKRCKHVNYSAQ